MEMEMMEAFRESYRGRYRLLRPLRREGRGLVGWVCTYVPEEILEAAGLHPFRILGGKEGDTAQADAYLYTNNCSFVRNCLEEGLRGELPPLDGLVTCNTCDQIRRLYDVWARYLPPPFHRQLCLPCHFGPPSLVTIDACDPGIASERQIKEQIRQYFQLLESRPSNL